MIQLVALLLHLLLVQFSVAALRWYSGNRHWDWHLSRHQLVIGGGVGGGREGAETLGGGAQFAVTQPSCGGVEDELLAAVSCLNGNLWGADGNGHPPADGSPAIRRF